MRAVVMHTARDLRVDEHENLAGKAGAGRCARR
jgi:hypothetical protein